jgi:hypothetical protein
MSSKEIHVVAILKPKPGKTDEVMTYLTPLPRPVPLACSLSSLANIFPHIITPGCQNLRRDRRESPRQRARNPLLFRRKTEEGR